MSATATDIVAELDRWLDRYPLSDSGDETQLIRRARDEIVALRASEIEFAQYQNQLVVATANARADALEEAARCVEDGTDEWRAKPIAAAIRALKDRAP